MAADQDEHYDPYYEARFTATSALSSFLNDREHQLTYEQGAPLQEVREQVKTSLGDADADHEKIAKAGAQRLGEWLENHGDAVTLAQGNTIAEIRDTLRDGAEQDEDG